MRVRILSAHYLFNEEEALLKQYGEALNKVAHIGYYSNIETRNVNIDMEVDSLDALGELSLEIQKDLLLARPIREGMPFELWIRDDFME